MADLAEPLVDPVATPATGIPACQLWTERFRRFAQSGLTITDFCKAEGVRTQAFYHWRAKLANLQTPRQSTTPRPEKPAFLPITLQQQRPTVELLLPTGLTLRLTPECDLRFVADLLKLLGTVPC